MDIFNRKRNKSLGVPELVAIALGGMVGGGIFTILGISVAMVGVFTPVAIIIGGMIAGDNPAALALGPIFKERLVCHASVS